MPDINVPVSKHHDRSRPELLLSATEDRTRRLISTAGETFLFLVATLSVFAVLFIFYFIVRDALPFIEGPYMKDFFASAKWYPTQEPPVYGAWSIIYGSIMVTIGATVISVPLGVCSAVALSDILPFNWRQAVKPVIELLASIPSVAYGFFALVFLAPKLQNHGGIILEVGAWMIGLPIAFIASKVCGGLIAEALPENKKIRFPLFIPVLLPMLAILALIGDWLGSITISSGTNAFNVSFILGIMALPTIVSVSEDALQAVGPDLRMGSYGLGATRSETMIKTVIPAASSGICAGIILGIMRALGETMVVWMASGNSARIPTPWYDFFAPVRTLTATIAGEMGETARETQHYYVLFVMAFFLLLVSFIFNLASEWVMKRNRMKLRGEI